MKKYELTYLASPELSENGIKTLQEKISSFIQKDEGFLNETSMAPQKRLAYPIKKRVTAYLVILNFQLDPKKLQEFEKKLRTETDILRHMVIVKPIFRKIETRPRRMPISRISEKTPKPKSKVEIAEIEKKLEEILK